MFTDTIAQIANALPADLLLTLREIPIFTPQALALEAGLLLLLILAPLVMELWVFIRNERFIESSKWVLLEIKVPREIDKTPKAMEQVLSVMHSLRNAAMDPQARYIEGEVPRWQSLEIVSIGGEIHFYVRAYYKQRDLIEAAFFSYYKDVEIVEVDDYMDRYFPEHAEDLYAQGYDMWGAELKLNKDDVYPIRSYVEFESLEDERYIDPMSNFLEVLAKVKKDERVGIQMLINGLDSKKWKEQWAPTIEKLRVSEGEEKKQAKTSGGASLGMEFHGGPLPVFPIKKSETKTENQTNKGLMRTPGETDTLKAVERNLTKPAFEVIIRFSYVSPKAIFNDTFARRGILAAFNQYSSVTLNSFGFNFPNTAGASKFYFPYFFSKQRGEARKQRLMRNFFRRETPPDVSIGRFITSNIFHWNIHTIVMQMSVESLATIFHPPTRMVLTAPHMVRVESRKTGPPAGLAIFGDEEHIEPFTSP